MDGGGKMELKIPFDVDDDDSLEPNRSAVKEEEEPTCLLLAIFLFLFVKQTAEELNSQVRTNQILCTDTL